MEYRVLGSVEAFADGRSANLGGPLERALLARLALGGGRAVSPAAIVDDLWDGEPPESAHVSVRVRISRLRKALAACGAPEAIRTEPAGYALRLGDGDTLDSARFDDLVRRGREALRRGSPLEASELLGNALGLWRGPALAGASDSPFIRAEAARLDEERLAVTADRIDARLASGEAAELVAELEGLCARHPLHERLWAQRMTALYRCGRQGDALAAGRRLREVLRDELGIDPSPEVVELERRILKQSSDLGAAPGRPLTQAALPTGIVTFLLTDIEGSTELWDTHPAAMAIALARHDEIVSAAVGGHDGSVIKSKGEGDSTLSVFRRASDAAGAVLDLNAALAAETWPQGIDLRVRMALHTGEAHERSGDYFGPAVNRAARLRALAAGGQIVVSQAAAEVVRDHLPEGVVLRSLGERELRGIARLEHVFELTTPGDGGSVPDARVPLERPALAPVLAARGPFVGREAELGELASAWAAATAGTARAVLVAGEPGVGKTRLAAECARTAFENGALVLYGRCDEELGAPYQPFAEALRALTPVLGARRLRSVRGVEQLGRLVPELGDAVPGLAVAPAQADPETERSMLFDALARLLAGISAEAPILVVIDDLHWAAKPTLLLLRHLLRSGEGTRLLVVGTYRSTDLDRSHPLAGALSDLHRDGTAARVSLRGLPAAEVGEYLTATGHRDAGLARALSSVTSGNPFFLIEVLRHLEEAGGRWDPNTLPQGVREAVSRRLSRLSELANETLLVGAVAGSQFALELVESVLERDLLAPIEEARRAELVVEESGGRFRFNHALVRQSLLSEVASLRRVRIHQRIAAAIEANPAVAGDALLPELARHWFECAFAGGAAKAVDYSRRAGEQAMARLAYEEAALLYDQAIQAAGVEGSGCSNDERGELLLARCEALLAAGDPTAAGAVVEALQQAARSSPRLSAWAACYAAQLAALTQPGRLDSLAAEVAAAAERFAQLGDAEGEAKAYTVRATCLARLGRVGDCEASLDRALTAARRAGNPRRVNAVLAGAPLAALWGPSPVARASGRCLDVVRVLRITTGSPAVEATALRCQAVLEALRGRTDAARRMLGSARKALESLGHTHGLLETDVFAGIVDLVAGRPRDAEEVLRRAYDGFVARGVGVDAAQAAALLARAVLAQGRVDEAIALTEESERLAGVDLKSAIAWRVARAEALAQRGDVAPALEAARAAVALAEPTDALIDQADAHMSLATVLRAGGQHADAEREARRAAELYERKGASMRVEAVVTRDEASAVEPPQPDRSALRRVAPNLATAAVQVHRWDLDHLEATLRRSRADVVCVDHRLHMSLDRDAFVETWRVMTLDGGHLVVDPAIASLGRRHCVCRCRWVMPAAAGGAEGPGGAEVEFLEVVQTDDEGRFSCFEIFEPGDLNPALGRMTELHAESELPPDRRPARNRVAAQCRAATPEWAETAVLVDHRPVNVGHLEGRDAIRAALRALGDVGGELRHQGADVLAFTEDWWLLDYRSEGRTESGEPFELPILWLGVHDGEGLVTRVEWFALEQLAEALARFDEVTSGRRARRRRFTPFCATWVIGGPVDDAQIVDWMTRLHPDVVSVDHRMKVTLRRDDLLDSFRAMSSGTRPMFANEIIATLGAHHCLTRSEWRTAEGRHSVPFGQVIQAAADGRALRFEQFEAGDLNAMIARLIELHAEAELPPERRAGRLAMAAQFRSMVPAWAEDGTLVDHRPVGLGTLRGRESILSAARALGDVAGEIRYRTVDILGSSEAFWLFHNIAEGRTDSGERFELPILWLSEHRPDGLVARAEWYAPEQVDQALARFDELSAGSPPRRRVRRNRAIERYETWSDRIAPDEINARMATLTDDFVEVDHRTQLTSGREERERTLRLFASMRDLDRSAEPLASLGERHGLVRRRWHMEGTAVDSWDVDAADIAALEVIRVDATERASRIERFAPEDLSEALARLVELHADDELPVERRAAQYSVATIYRSQDSRWNDDCVLEDRRPAGLGTVRGADALRDPGRALHRLIGGLRRRITDVYGLTEHHLLALIVTRGDVDGGGVEFPVVVLAEYGEDGLTRRAVWYTPEQLSEALAQFDELVAREGGGTSGGAHVAALTNDAVVQRDRLTDARIAGDWDGFAAGVAETAVLDDRRRMVRMRAEGRDALVDYARSLKEAGVTWFRRSVLATRGSRLALERIVLGGERGEVEGLSIVEFDAAGKMLAQVVFEPDDLDAAFADLDERYISGEGAASAEILRAALAFVAAQNQGEWERCRALLSADFTVVEHRPPPGLFAGVRGPDAFIAAVRSASELSRGFRASVVAVHRAAVGIALLQLRSTGSTLDGAEFELSFHVVGTARLGLLASVEYFADDQLDAATARFDELREAVSRRVLTNDALVTWSRCWEAILARDWAGLESLMADDAVMDDRRPIVRIRAEGRAALLQHMRSLADAGVSRVETVPVATRGARLALQRVLFAGSDGEAELLSIEEIDETGLWRGPVAFDAGDIEAALDELDARYARGEGAAAAADLELGTAMRVAYRERDWDAFERLLAADFVCDDHRPAGWGRLDRAQYVAHGRGLPDIADDVRVCITEVLRIAEGVVAFMLRFSGTEAFGGRFEIEFAATMTTGGGRVRSLDFYAADGVDAALERFEELRSARQLDAPSHLRNEAARRVEVFWDAALRNDWAAVQSLVADGALVEDFRAGIGGYRVEGRAAHVDAWKAMVHVGVDRIAATPLATRGERLALLDVVYRGESGEVETLRVFEIDEHGRLLYTAAFDPGDLDAAHEALDARFRAGGAARSAYASEAITGAIRAFNARDWDTVRASLTTDFRVVDHRPASWGEFDADTYVRAMRTLVELVPDAGVRLLAVPRVSARGGVAVVQVRGVDVNGAHIEIQTAQLGISRDDRLCHEEVYAVEDLERAVARFDELTGGSLLLENACTRLADRLDLWFRDGDESAVLASLSGDFVEDDRRTLLRTVLSGEQARANWRLAAGFMAGRGRERATIATRGDHLALFAVTLRGSMGAGGDAEVPLLAVDELDGSGRVCREATFDPDDVDAAFDELDARYLAGEAAPFAAAWTHACETLAAARERDWSAFAGRFSERCAVVDHRSLTMGRFLDIGRDDLVRVFTDTAELAPDVRWRIACVHRIGEAGIAFSARTTGARTEGGAFELVAVVVATVRDGLTDRLEMFSEDDVDAALVRFEELTNSAHVAGVAVASRGERLGLRRDASGSLVLVDAGVEDPVARFDGGELAAALSALDDRYAAQLPDAEAAVWRVARELTDRYNARDHDGLRAAFAADCVIVDDRLTGWGQLDGGTFVANTQQLITMAPDVFLMCVTVHTVTPHGAATRLRTSGTIPGGGEFEMLFESAITVEDGRVVRMEMLPEGRVAEAVERLRAPGGVTP